MATLLKPNNCATALVEATTQIADSADDKSKGEDIVLEGTGKKDIRKHPKYSFLYQVHRYNTLYHVVERLGSQEHKNKSYVRKIRFAYREMKRKAPMLSRFTMELLPILGKRRIAMFLLGDLITKSMIPITRNNAKYELAAITIEAIRKRSMDWLAVSRAVLSDVGGYILEQCLDKHIKENQAKLTYRYSSYLREQIMKARRGLDSVTLGNEKVQAHFDSVTNLLATSWDDSFILTRASSLINDVTKIINATMHIHKITSTHNSRLATWSFILKLAFMVRYYIGYLGYGSRNMTAITDENYRRSNIMYKASEEVDAQDQILGLQDYYYEEYKRAQQAVGDVSADKPDIYNKDLLHPWRSIFYKTTEKLNGSLLYLLLALNAIHNPTASIAEASTIINDLTALQTATWEFSYSIYRLLGNTQAFVDNMTPIEKYYTLAQLKPLLRRDQTPLQYKPVSSPSSVSSVATEVLLETEPSLLCSGAHQRHGMTIEFNGVSFTYPNKFKKALNNVSFKIEAGQLCSIVGFSGSGKSTLIALLVRLHDPDDGTIHINGIDIKRYDPQELYKHISFLFQKTEKPTFTIRYLSFLQAVGNLANKECCREFIRLGRLNATDEEIEKAIKDSGADEIINKFKCGIDTELSARHCYDEAVTVEMLVKKAQVADEGEMMCRGQSGHGKREDDDDEDDPRTDADLLDALTKTLGPVFSVKDSDALSIWTSCGSKEELPDPLEDEQVVLKEGYDALKAEEEERKNQVDTANFSGGEWSKLVLARSFLRNSADLVILDEFSAALDPLSEASIFEKFMKYRGQKTIIAVTHRFHLAYRSDLILFLQDGELKEKGRHHDLMKMDGKYKEMYLKTTNVSGKEMACQTVAEGEEHVPIPLEVQKEAEKVDEKNSEKAAATGLVDPASCA